MDVLGSFNFSETPTVNDAPVLLNNTGSALTVYTGNVARTTGTTRIPRDNTTPLSSEGTQLWAQALTPVSTSSKFVINYALDVGSSATRYITIALFRGTTCLTSRTTYTTTTIQPQCLSLTYTDTPATTSSITYSVRVGVSTSATWTVNGASAATMGGTNDSGWLIMELA